MNREEVQGWLDEYVAAWSSYDRDAIEALFSEGARYRYRPWDDWLDGREAIAGDWLSDRDDPESWSAAYEPFAVAGDTAVAIGRSTYTNPDGSVRTVYENCFLLRFDSDGRCSEFTEFFMEHPAGEPSTQ